MADVFASPAAMSSDLRGGSWPGPPTRPFERLLSDLSAAFIALPPNEIENAIEASLARTVAGFGIDRATLTRVLPLNGRIEVTHSFAVAGVDPVPKSLSVSEESPWALKMAMANRPIVFTRLDDLPPEARVDKGMLRSIGLKSHVTMPIMVAGQLQGGLSFGCVRTERKWPVDTLRRMRLLANVFGSALAMEELADILGFERLAKGIMGSLALAQPGQANGTIQIALGHIGQFMGAQRVALWDRDLGDGEFRSIHRWHADGAASPSNLGNAPELPWITHRLATGETVRVPEVNALSSEAERDRATLLAAGVRSLLAVPITTSGRVAGALSIASTQRANQWPDVLMPGVGLLADVFGSFHARDAAEHRKLASEVEAANWRERLVHLVRMHTAGEVSVALAHEITQPLGAIENYAMAARRRAGEAAPDVARVVELLDKVIGQTARAGDVVRRMRSIAERHALDPVPIDVERAISECIDVVKMDCELRGIELRLRAESGLPAVIVDEIHLQQVILNLLRSVIEASKQSAGARAISLATALNLAGEVQVEVTDSGSGIVKDDLEWISELTICRKLIEAHGGRLWVSHNPGGGVVFRFTIPAPSRED